MLWLPTLRPTIPLRRYRFSTGSKQPLSVSATRRSVAGTYEKPVGGLPYIIAYALEATPTGDERIVILRVIHGARNWRQGEWPK
jgi:plasmid stabilization system protein ParE